MEAGGLCVKVSITGRKRELRTRSCGVEYYITISIFGYVAPDYEVFIKEEVFKIWLYICLNYSRMQKESSLLLLCFWSVRYCPILHDCPENGTIFGRKCFSHSACLDFIYNFCLVLLQTTKTPVKCELGRSSGKVFFFLFYPNLNNDDACLQYRLSQKSDHWDRNMTRQIVSFRNLANAPKRRTLKSTQKWYNNVRYLATWNWNLKMNLFVVFSKKIPFMKVAAFSTKGTLTGKLNIQIYLTRLNDFTKEYPLARGMITYSFIWPISNLCQQTIRGNKEWDFAEALRFCLYGSCFVAPTLYGWLRLAVSMWPQQNFRSTLAKALVEQISYTPFAMVCFFFIMTLLEGKTIREASSEVRVKFLPTYKVGACVWPVLQTINYTLVSEKNRVPFVGMCSLLWTCFLAYMKQLEAQKLAKKQATMKVSADQQASPHYVLLLQ